jgi:adenine-specific DNA-methyltransferase
MAKATKSKKKPIAQYDHKGKKRVNNPPVGLVTPETDKETGKKTYAYDPHIDPQLVWAGKAERTSFEVPTISLHVHERIDPRTIIEAVWKRNGQADQQMFLFQSPEENPPLREAIEFYRHPHNWSNRLIAGDSLLVISSLRASLDEWVKAVNEHGGFGMWRCAVSRSPGDVAEILHRLSN